MTRRAWERFLNELERTSGEYGPVPSWEAPGVAQVVMAADVDDRAQLAQDLTVRVTDALRAVGRPDLYPSEMEIEPATAGVQSGHTSAPSARTGSKRAGTGRPRAWLAGPGLAV